MPAACRILKLMKKSTTDNSPVWMDTWGWVALGDRGEKYHKDITVLYEQAITGQILTSDYILDETITLLFRRLPFDTARKFTWALLKAVQEGYVQLRQVTSSAFEAAWDLRLRYSDKPDVSFTDFTSFALMKEHGIRRVVTQDRHFEQIGFGFHLLPS